MTALLADVEERTRDDATELHRRLKETGDPAAQEALVRRYQGLVRRLASRYNSGQDGVRRPGPGRQSRPAQRAQAVRPRPGSGLPLVRRPHHPRRAAPVLPRHPLGRAHAARPAGALPARRARRRRAQRPSGARAHDRRHRPQARADRGAGRRGNRRALRLRRAARSTAPRPMPTATRTSPCSTRWARRRAATSSWPTASRSPRRCARCPSASRRSCACASSRTSPRPRSRSVMGVSQMQVSRLLRRSLDRLRVVAEASEVAEVAEVAVAA